jgi:hypothetical protein
MVRLLRKTTLPKWDVVIFLYHSDELVGIRTMPPYHWG